MTDKRRLAAALLNQNPEYDYGTILPLKHRRGMDPDQLSTDYMRGDIQPAMPGLLAEMLNSPVKSGQMIAGEREIDPGEVFMQAMDFSPASVLNKAPMGSLGMFAGRRAKTADLNKMKMAEKMLDDGIDRADVWRETGWMRGPDGKMRFEIDDSGSALTARGSGDTAFDASEDLLNHQNLYDAYPDTRRTLTQFESGNQLSGSYTPGENRSHLGLFDLDEKIKVSGPDRQSTALHELQHAVQNREGFSTGGNPSRNRSVGIKNEDEALQAAKRAYNDSMGDSDLLAQLGIDVLPPEYWAKAGITPPGNRSMKPWEELTRREQVGWLERGRQSNYHRLAGEAEARNVQTRIDMTPEQRRASPPWETLDVPESDLIVRGGTGTPAMGILSDQMTDRRREGLADLLRQGVKSGLLGGVI